MQSDIVQRLQPILHRNGWGNVQEYARHIPFMLEREGLTIVESAEITRLTEALRAAEEREKGLREALGEICRDSNPDWTERRVYPNDVLDDIHKIAVDSFYGIKL